MQQDVIYTVTLDEDIYEVVLKPVGLIQVDSFNTNTKWNVIIKENDIILYNDIYMETFEHNIPDTVEVGVTLANYGKFSKFFTHYFVKNAIRKN